MQAGIRLCLAHCNFGLRGNASDQDEAFVRKIASNSGIDIYVKSFNTREYAQSSGLSIQIAARELRYGWFEELLNQEKGAFLLTAHHADDQLETFLMHIGRGSGIEGLCGIPARNKRIRRPLLPFSRAELEAFATAEKIEWREDASNATLQYDRNRFRHLVIPSLKEAAPGFLKGFATTLKYLKGSRAILEDYARELRHRLGESTGEEMRYRVADLLGLEPREDYLFLLFREYGFTDWRAISDLLSGISGKEVTSSTHRVLRDREFLCIRPLAKLEDGVFIVEADSPGIETPLQLQIRTVQGMGPTDVKILYADKETLNKGLLLRKWRKGDYFYPLGMKGARKLVSKFFKDLKLSQFEKEAQWLLCSGEDIVWIPGLRADERFKVTETTRNILQIEWQE
jgi:tRNA(Ile)-lysidine synthase